MKYLEELIVFTEHQLGFREDTSCVTNLLSFHEKKIHMEYKARQGRLCVSGSE